MRRLRLAIVAAAVLAPGTLAAAPQAARPNVVASSYDVRLEVLADGSLDVVESVALAVGAKPITWFERAVPDRRTDGLTNVTALMDGQAVPVAIDRRNGLKVRWEFSPTANATHTFEIRYRAVHVLAREIDGPRLVWTALPRKRTYPIDSAEISVFAPAGSIATYVEAIGGDVAPATPERPGVVIVGNAIKRDRAITVDISFAPNSITPAEPQWFVNQEQQRKMVPAWLAAAAALFAVGIGILVMLFARLPKPSMGDAFAVPASEGSVPPALVTLLMSRGQSNSWLALQSAFFRLVRDGRLVVEKRGERRWFSAPVFAVSLGDGGGGALASHEEWILNGVRNERGPADLRRLTTRFSRRQRAFLSHLMAEAAARGWIDAERQRARSGLLVTGFVLMLAGAGGAVAMLLAAARLGPAAIAMPGVVFFVGVIYIVVSSAMSLLSEAGLREALRWQARVGELKEVVKNGVSGQSPKDFERWFPLAIGAGIGARWLKAFEAQLVQHGADIAWLRSMGSPADAAASLGMMVAISGASHAGGAGGASGGAGGGSSGAG